MYEFISVQIGQVIMKTKQCGVVFKDKGRVSAHIWSILRCCSAL